MTIAVSGDSLTFPDNSVQNTAATGFGFKNRIINGAMVIDQRNAGASVTPATKQYTIDRWGVDFSQASKFSVQQNVGAVTPPTGFANYLGITSVAATSLGATDYFNLAQYIEGYNFADLGWGTVSAQPVTLSFWVRSSLTGTFGGSLINSANTRSYPFSYTVSSANTWTQATVTIAGDTSGTWVGATNGIGAKVWFSLGSGSTYSGTAGAWGSTLYLSATGATSVVGTTGATFYITGVQLEKGSTATSFDYRPYGTELALCQRYLPAYNLASGETVGFSASNSTTNLYCNVGFLVATRVSPTGISFTGQLTSYNSSALTASAVAFGAASQSAARLNLTVSGATANQAFTTQASAASQLLFTGCEL